MQSPMTLIKGVCRICGGGGGGGGAVTEAVKHRKTFLASRRAPLVALSYFLL